MRGLDPRIHDEMRHAQTVLISLLRFIMDCRVKPGNNSSRGAATPSESCAGSSNEWTMREVARAPWQSKRCRNFASLARGLSFFRFGPILSRVRPSLHAQSFVNIVPLLAAGGRAFAMRAKRERDIIPAGDGVHGFERSARARQSACAQAAECFEYRFALRRDVGRPRPRQSGVCSMP